MAMTITPAVAKVLKSFLADINEPKYGFNIMKETGLTSGSVYRIVVRLQKAGLIRSEREDIDPHSAGRPARTYYKLTADGVVTARLELAAASELMRPPNFLGQARPESGLT